MLYFIYRAILLLGLAACAALAIPGAVAQVVTDPVPLEGLSIFGVPADWIAIGAAVILLCERIAKVIPDSATGPLAAIRKFLKIVGAYTPNK